MSSYVVSDITINRVLGWMQESAHRQRFVCLAAERGILPLATLGRVATAAHYAALGQAMFALNVEAVHQRYPGVRLDDLPGEIGHTSYTYSYELVQPIQALKSLDCLLYQCNEGDVSETPLYAFLEYVQCTLMQEIICHTPAYDNAEWR